MVTKVYFSNVIIESLSLVDGVGLSEFAARNLKDWNISLNNSFYAYLMQCYPNNFAAIVRGNSIKYAVNLIFQESAWRMSLFKGQYNGMPEHEQQNYFKILCEK